MPSSPMPALARADCPSSGAGNPVEPGVKAKRFDTVITGAAIVLTAAVSYVSVGLAARYLHNHSYFFDAAGYSYFNALFYCKIQLLGLFPAIWEEICTNQRFPIRTVPLALFAPSLLAHPMGHVATSIPALFAFLSVFGIAVKKRSHSTFLAVCSMVMFCSLGGIFDPNYGFATYWLDLTAALWAGAAAMCLINSDETRSTKWIIAFSIFASCATLSRYIAAGFVLFSCLPVLLMFTCSRFSKKENLKEIFKPYLYMLCVIGLLAGTFLISNCKANFDFYSQCCYSLHQALQISWFDETQATRIFFQDSVLCVLLFLGLLQICLARKVSAGWSNILVAVWLGISTHVLMIFVLRANGGGPQTYYSVPLLVFALLSPVAMRQGLKLPFARVFGVCILALSINSFVGSYALHSLRTEFPSQTAKETKAFDVEMGDLIARGNGSLVWNEFFDERAWLPTLEAFYKTGKFCMPAGQIYFTVHESGWTSQFPGLTPDEVAQKVVSATNKLVKLAVVFDDPETVEKSRLNNKFSKAVAMEVAREMRRNPQWEKLDIYKTKEFGTLAIYSNSKADEKAFSKFFERNSSAIHPMHVK